MLVQRGAPRGPMRRGHPGRSPAPTKPTLDPRRPVAPRSSVSASTGNTHLLAMPADGPDQVRERSGDRTADRVHSVESPWKARLWFAGPGKPSGCVPGASGRWPRGARCRGRRTAVAHRPPSPPRGQEHERWGEHRVASEPASCPERPCAASRHGLRPLPTSSAHGASAWSCAACTPV